MKLKSAILLLFPVSGRMGVKNRRVFLKLAALSAVKASAAKPCLAEFSDQKEPNIVVIIADDLGYADMSFLPQAPTDVKRFGTPGLDRLAQTGVYFENACACPICSPSCAGLITGRYQQQWGNYWYGQGGLPLEELTIPEALKQQGYTCA